MKKFRVIEEGRLDASQLIQITGGGKLTCSSSGTQIYQQCANEGTLASCPIKYKSCASSSDHLVCNLDGGYNGVPGSAGLTTETSDLVP